MPVAICNPVINGRGEGRDKLRLTHDLPRTAARCNVAKLLLIRGGNRVYQEIIINRLAHMDLEIKRNLPQTSESTLININRVPIELASRTFIPRNIFFGVDRLDISHRR
jgi:hypothetical protein